MTRINVGVLPKMLTDEHLLAEHREIKRLPAYYPKAFRTHAFDRIPAQFCLGIGHVTFFLDKSPYTLARYVALYEECLARGFAVQDYRANWDLYGGYGFAYEALPADIQAVVDRIVERIEASPKGAFHYRGKLISKKQAIKKLLQFRNPTL